MYIKVQNTEITIYLGSNLNYLMKRDHISNSKLIDLLEDEKALVSDIALWIAGIKVPELSIIIKLALIFSVSLDDLITVNMELLDSTLK